MLSTIICLKTEKSKDSKDTQFWNIYEKSITFGIDNAKKIIVFREMQLLNICDISVTKEVSNTAKFKSNNELQFSNIEVIDTTDFVLKFVIYKDFKL